MDLIQIVRQIDADITLHAAKLSLITRAAMTLNIANNVGDIDLTGRFFKDRQMLPCADELQGAGDGPPAGLRRCDGDGFIPPRPGC